MSTFKTLGLFICIFTLTLCGMNVVADNISVNAVPMGYDSNSSLPIVGQGIMVASCPNNTKSEVLVAESGIASNPVYTIYICLDGTWANVGYIGGNEWGNAKITNLTAIFDSGGKIVSINVTDSDGTNYVLNAKQFTWERLNLPSESIPSGMCSSYDLSNVLIYGSDGKFYSLDLDSKNNVDIKPSNIEVRPTLGNTLVGTIGAICQPREMGSDMVFYGEDYSLCTGTISQSGYEWSLFGWNDPLYYPNNPPKANLITAIYPVVNSSGKQFYLGTAGGRLLKTWPFDLSTDPYSTTLGLQQWPGINMDSGMPITTIAQNKAGSCYCLTSIGTLNYCDDNSLNGYDYQPSNKSIYKFDIAGVPQIFYINKNNFIVTNINFGNDIGVALVGLDDGKIQSEPIKLADQPNNSVLGEASLVCTTDGNYKLVACGYDQVNKKNLNQFYVIDLPLNSTVWTLSVKNNTKYPLEICVSKTASKTIRSNWDNDFSQDSLSPNSSCTLIGFSDELQKSPLELLDVRATTTDSKAIEEANKHYGEFLIGAGDLSEAIASANSIVGGTAPFKDNGNDILMNDNKEGTSLFFSQNIGDYISADISEIHGSGTTTESIKPFVATIDDNGWSIDSNGNVTINVTINDGETAVSNTTPKEKSN